MFTPKYAPVYDLHTAQRIVHSTDLGSHQTNELADGTMTIATNTIDMPEYGFEALASIRLDEMEMYRLYVLLHAKFTAQTDGRA
jgi:hypothetical protein